MSREPLFFRSDPYRLSQGYLVFQVFEDPAVPLMLDRFCLLSDGLIARSPVNDSLGRRMPDPLKSLKRINDTNTVIQTAMLKIFRPKFFRSACHRSR
jgi:hypothetical protein